LDYSIASMLPIGKFMRSLMRQIIAVALVSTLSMAMMPIPAAAAQGQAGSLAGTAQTATGQTVANVRVQLRNLANGTLSGSTTSSGTGAFSFTGLAAGNYSVEIVNAAGQIIGTSAAIPVAAGAAVTGITVTASAAAAGGAAAAAAAGGGAAATGGISTAVIVTTVAVGAGIAAVIVVKNRASASQ
jgi:hypothetical protein